MKFPKGYESLFGRIYEKDTIVEFEENIVIKA
jgi:hypothetical protein